MNDAQGEESVSSVAETAAGTPQHSFRLWLRDGTRDEHASLDAAMQALDLSTKNGYALFLQLHIQSLRQLRSGYRHQDRQDFTRLLHCAENDLRGIHGFALPATKAIEPAPSYAHALGIGYVIRGSRLGAKVLRRRVASALPLSYLDSPTSIPWSLFVSELDRFGDTATDTVRNGVMAGAKLAFGVYARACAGMVPPPTAG